MFDSRKTLTEGTNTLLVPRHAHHMLLLVPDDGALLSAIFVDGGNLDGYSFKATLNGDSYDLLISDQEVLDGNGIFCPGETDLTLLKRQTVRFTYNAQEGHWYVAGV